MLKNVGAMDPFGGALDGSLSKWNHLHEEKSRVRVKETGHCGRIEAINAHGGHVVRLDSGHTIEATDDELEPEDWHGHRSRPTPSSKSRTVDFAKTMLAKFDGLRTADVSERDRVLIDSAIRQVEDGAFANATNPFAGLDDTDADPPPITLLKIIQSKYETSSGGDTFAKAAGGDPVGQLIERTIEGLRAGKNVIMPQECRTAFVREPSLRALVTSGRICFAA